jgi:uncharacterized SAM-binding protein YcdF (DUF218 family)
MEWKEYFTREGLGVIVYPVIFYLIATLFFIVGYIDRQDAKIYWTMSAIMVIAGLLNLFITSVLTKRLVGGE